MVRVPLCRPNPCLRALFDKEALFEKQTPKHARRSCKSAGISCRRPTLEEKHLFWSTFSYKKYETNTGADKYRCSDGSEILPELECVKVRRTGLELQIATDSCILQSDKASLSNVASHPSAPATPRAKSLSPKDMKEMRQMSAKSPIESSNSNSPKESPKESPMHRPPTPPTVPRVRQAPRNSKRLMTPPEMTVLEVDDQAAGSGQVASEEKAQAGPCISVGDFRQCPVQFWGELHAKFSCSAASSPKPMVTKKVPPVLTARQLGITADTELSENWHRFEQRKLRRKERSLSKKTSPHQLNPNAKFFLRYTQELRLCGLMASKLAQPADAFSCRSSAGMTVPETECTAFRAWV